MPMPDPATATDGVFYEGDEAVLLGDGARRWSRRSREEAARLMATMTYLQAISDGLREEMREDERVFVMGEDIGVFGGAFKVTDGFIEEFGADRVMDTPLAESGDHRHRRRRGRRRHAAGVRDAVLRLHLLRLRPARQRRRQDALPPGPAGEPITVRLPSGGGFSGGPVPLAEPRGVVHARARPEGRRALAPPRTPRAC